MQKAIRATQQANNVVVFSGAGMSADSGIGTFRGQGGAWSGIFGTLALLWGGTPVGWRWTPGLVWSRFVQDFYAPIAAASPHEGHLALQELCDKGGFDSFAYITMNVDGLHQASGAQPDQVSEVHGSVCKYRCMACDKKLPDVGELDPKRQPRCDSCGGRARPDATLFTEALPDDEWQTARRFIGRLKRGDVMLVAGTSSVVYPAASLPVRAAEKGVTIIEFNKDFPTPLSEIASIAVEGRAAEAFPEFVAGVLETRAQANN